MKPAIGTQVMITGIDIASPYEVFNGRTGIVSAHPDNRFGLVTVHLTYAVTPQDIELGYGRRGTLEDFTDDIGGNCVDFLPQHLVDAPELIDPDGDEARTFVTHALAEIRSMARRTRDEVWQVVAEEVTPERVRAELDYRITTRQDARAWVHHRRNTDRWGF